ncbi:MAG: TatD family hydrolase [Desulfobacterales bacterium]|nr:TatD family hydrolase [Desulfobacterales bacterium]
MKIFDSHCHLDDPSYADDMDRVLLRMHEAEVRRAIIVGITEASAQRAVVLAEAHEEFFASVGIHPHDAQSCSEKALESLETLAQSPRVCAWGEIGLDFNRMHSPRPAQERWFVRQMELGRALGLPMIFHERDTNGRFLELLRAHGGPSRRGVVHCFSGTRDEMMEILALGYHIGITGILTIKSRGATLRELTREIPADRLLIETDAPYLTPTPERNKHRRNEPAFVRSVLVKLAEVRGDDPEALADTLWHNTCALFGIDPDITPTA